MSWVCRGDGGLPTPGIAHNIPIFAVALLLAGIVLAGEENGSPVKEKWELKADRSLTAQEATKLVELTVVVTGRPLPRSRPSSLSWRVAGTLARRREAARRLGEELGHLAAIPVLLSVLEDEGEDRGVRYAALTSVSLIADKSIVPLILKFLEDPDQSIRSRAQEQLMKLSGRSPSFGLGDHVPQEERAKAVAEWRAWWEENKEIFVFDRSRMLYER